MGPNGSGKSTFAHVLMGKPGYQVLGGTVTLDGADLLRLPPWRRARLGLFLAPQYPTEVPGVGLHQRSPRLWSERGAGARRRRGSLATRGLDEARRVGLETRLLERRSTWICPVVSASAARRCRWRCCGRASPFSTSSTRASTSTGCATWPAACATRWTEWGLGVLAITHYRRLLSVLRPDVVHVLVRGRIVASGGPELAGELERTGYAAFESAPGTRRRRRSN